MCGISGMICRSGNVDGSVIRRMHKMLRHRGPDGEGHYGDGYIEMMHRRLSIIDLEGGSQPLFNEDRSLVLVANGEIYNHVELRERLKDRGHRFATGSDCETILHLYEECGTDCVRQLRGMFAFALWDTRLRRLVLARDRMGEKPLFLYQSHDRLLFASELKAMLASGVVPFQLDPHAVDLYFHYGYVPEPLTAVQGITKLDAAQVLTVDIDPWRVETNCYWQLENAPPLEGDSDELIREQLEDVSRLVIRSDVPVGVALSGGLDSSLITALAAKDYPGTLHAFSVGYPGRPEFDERREAKALAEYLHIPLHEVEISSGEMVDFFPELFFWQDDPIANIAAYAYFSIMKRAGEVGVPVILQGHGGDELFWGYPWVRQCVALTERKQQRGRPSWLSLPRYLSPLGNGVPAAKLYSPGRISRAVRDGWHRFLVDYLSPTGQMVFYDHSPDFRQAQSARAGLYTASFRDQLKQRAHDLFTFETPWPRVDIRMTDLICRTYLREDGIALSDRLSMASSVELRLPLVDHRFVETAVGLRKAKRDDDQPPKIRLRKAIEPLLPKWVLNRKKRGFQPPLHLWYQQLFDRYGSMLPGGFLEEAGILSSGAANRLAAGEFPRRTVHPLSFKALCLEQWCRSMAAIAASASTGASSRNTAA